MTFLAYNEGKLTTEKSLFEEATTCKEEVKKKSLEERLTELLKFSRSGVIPIKHEDKDKFLKYLNENHGDKYSFDYHYDESLDKPKGTVIYFPKQNITSKEN